MTSLPSPPSTTYLLAAFCGGAANIFLGSSSLYWRELNEVLPQTLVAYRIVLSLCMLAALIFLGQGFYELKKLRFRTVCLHCGASLLVATNWGVFIWASINGHILESGFGYLLAPFLSISMGVLFYREPLKSPQIISMIIVFSSAALLALYSHELNHWIYILIAATWGTYTCLKKATSLSAINGLFVETAFLSICLTLATAIFK